MKKRYFILFSVALVSVLTSCTGENVLPSLSPIIEDEEGESSVWTSNTITGKWLSDCVDLENSGESRYRFYYMISENNLEGFTFSYPTSQACQTIVGGTYNAFGSQGISIHSSELSSSGLLQTISSGSFFSIEINANNMDALFWGSDSSQDRMIISDRGIEFLSNDIVNFDALNTGYASFLSQNLSQIASSNLNQGYLMVSRQPESSTPDDFGSSN